MTEQDATPRRRPERGPRRKKGTGSLFLRSDARRTSWQGSVLVPGETRRRCFTAPGSLTPEQAAQRFEKWKRRVFANPGRPRRTPVSTVLHEINDRRLQLGKLQPRQHKRRRELIARWEAETPFRDVAIEDLGDRDILGFFEHMKHGVERRRWGDDNRNCLTFWHMLNRACEWAAAKGLREVNACSEDNKPKVRDEAVECLLPHELDGLFAAAEGSAIEWAVKLAVAVGWRQGEQFAFVDDPRFLQLDGDQPFLWIAKNLDEYRQIKDGTKTAAGLRFFPLSPYDVEMIQAQRDANATVRATRGGDWNAADLLFPNQDGGTCTQHELERLWFPMLRAAGLPRRVWHSLRHSCCTAMICAGVPDGRVADLVGHTSAATTNRLYGHFKNLRGSGQTALTLRLYSQLLGQAT